MRFRFCGDDDCPDWILAQINTLSRMNLAELSKLIKIVAESLINSTNLATNIAEISTEVELDVEDCKATIAAIVFIFTYSIRFSVSDMNLSNELQQIGLPAKHALCLCDVYNEKQASLTATLAKERLKCTNVKQFHSLIKDDQLVIGMDIRDNINNIENDCWFRLPKDQLELLILDLKEVYERMNCST